MAKKGHFLCNRATDQKIIFCVARTFFSRLKGFLGKNPQRGDALLIVPCKQVHTFFMRCPLDIYYLDREGNVVECFLGVRPWRVLPYSLSTYMVLETGVDTFPMIAKGEKLLLWQEK